MIYVTFKLSSSFNRFITKKRAFHDPKNQNKKSDHNTLIVRSLFFQATKNIILQITY